MIWQTFGRNKRQTRGLQKRQTAQERTNHTSEREIKPKQSPLKADSRAVLRPFLLIVYLIGGLILSLVTMGVKLL